MNHLDGIKAKVARALELLFQFDKELHAYLDLDPISLVRQIQPDGETHAIAVQATIQPPIPLSLLVGEIVHQLRSAVDHIAYGLVLADGKSPTKRTSFPVCTQRPTRLTIAGGVSPEALGKVDSLQPYQQQDSTAHPLHILNELWNVDKHRNLHLAVLMVTNTQVFLGAPGGPLLVGGQFQEGAIGDDGIIGIFKFPGGVIDPALEITATGSNFLALGELGAWPNDLPVQTLLEQLYNFVSKNVLTEFETLLKGV